MTAKKLAPAPSRPTPYLADPDPACFPRAELYRTLNAHRTASLRETTTRRKAYPHTERHLHCVWYDPELRPARLTTRAGESVTVENPGLWNQEAGPDFIGAVLRIGPAARRMAGDVEIHIHPSDWKAHGHADDPRYRQVRFHLTYFPGAASDIDLVPGANQIVLKEALATLPGFSFEQIDVAAYPYAARADMPPCSTVLASYTPDQRIEVLRAAGEERLRRKTERIRTRIEEIGEEASLYEETMAALGYKHNKAAFRYVAQCVPVDELLRESSGDALTGYALLMGAAGLLPQHPQSGWDPETTRWIRQRWDCWWRYRDRYAGSAPPPTWRLDGMRPANHPTRRLMAAAQLFSAEEPFSTRIKKVVESHPDTWLRKLMAHLAELNDPYLSMRLSLTGRPRDKAIALIGPTRAAALLTNVVLPYLAAIGQDRHAVCHALDDLPVEPDNGVIKQTAFYLFGRDHSPTLYKSELARQGLIQIFQDFCLNDRSRCNACPFPQALENHLHTLKDTAECSGRDTPSTPIKRPFRSSFSQRKFTG